MKSLMLSMQLMSTSNAFYAFTFLFCVRLIALRMLATDSLRVVVNSAVRTYIWARELFEASERLLRTMGTWSANYELAWSEVLIFEL